MGRVRTKTIKRAAKVLLEKYYQKLTADFHTNKKILSEVGKVPTKKLRNKIAGFATHLMKRIQKGPVKGISLKVQEEERERRLDWVPTTSEINIEKVEIDDKTQEMLAKRFGPGFYAAIKDNLANKAPELPKTNQNRDKGKRQGRGERDGGKERTRR
jgi:small subunit ribosomal protein S17e